MEASMLADPRATPCRHARLPWRAAIRLSLTGLVLLPALWAGPTRAEGAERVLALGGAVTEIVHALGQGDRLVARDTTSSYPPEAVALPDVGYVRALSPEGVLSVDPDLILAIEGSGPPETMEVLRAADIPLVIVPEGYDAAAIVAKITVVAEALGVPEAGSELAGRVESALAAARGGDRLAAPPRVLFILSMEGGRIMAAGQDTAAAGVIALAGGVNALSGFQGYSQVSDEAILLADPDVILMMDRSGDHALSDAQIMAHPVLGRTRAAATGAILRQPGLLLLGFGPRTPRVVEALSAAFRQARS
jgi:iron complex transport system substrate-binding protein